MIAPLLLSLNLLAQPAAPPPLVVQVGATREYHPSSPGELAKVAKVVDDDPSVASLASNDPWRITGVGPGTTKLHVIFSDGSEPEVIAVVVPARVASDASLAVEDTLQLTVGGEAALEGAAKVETSSSATATVRIQAAGLGVVRAAAPGKARVVWREKNGAPHAVEVVVTKAR